MKVVSCIGGYKVITEGNQPNQPTILFESERADEAIQWAIDHTADYISLEETIKFDANSRIKGRK